MSDDVETNVDDEILKLADEIRSNAEAAIIDMYKAAHANYEASKRSRAALLKVQRLAKYTRVQLLAYQKRLFKARRDSKEKDDG